MAVSIIISAEQADELLEAGRDRSSGVEVSLTKVQEILHTNLGIHSLTEALPRDVAIRCFAPKDEPRENYLIIFSRKRLEDIEEGTYKATQDELEH